MLFILSVFLATTYGCGENFRCAGLGMTQCFKSLRFSEENWRKLEDGPAIIALYPHTSKRDGFLGKMAIDAISDQAQRHGKTVGFQSGQIPYKVITSLPKTLRAIGRFPAEAIVDSGLGAAEFCQAVGDLKSRGGFAVIFPEGGVKKRNGDRDGIVPSFIEMAIENQIDIIFGYFEYNWKACAGETGELHLSSRVDISHYPNLPSRVEAQSDQSKAQEYFRIVDEILDRGRAYFNYEAATSKSANPQNAQSWRVQPRIREKYRHVYPEVMMGQELLFHDGRPGNNISSFSLTRIDFGEFPEPNN